MKITKEKIEKLIPSSMLVMAFISMIAGDGIYTLFFVVLASLSRIENLLVYGVEKDKEGGE